MKRLLLITGIVLLVLISLTGKWVTDLTPAEVEEYKMWIKLAKAGYAEPMKMTSDKSWWETLTGE